MIQPIQVFYENYRELNDFLIDHGEYSLSSEVNHHFRKIYLLSCASYYESQIVDMIKQFIQNNSSDDRVLTFATNKAIDRQYHTYFDRKQTTNVNAFLGLFGMDFKERISLEIKRNEKLSEQVMAFLTIGVERNKMVHGNFLEYTLDKTFGELLELNNKASQFINYLKAQFNP